MPTAYLLDLDGTLIDSEPYYKRVEVDVLQKMGVPMTFEEMEGYTGTPLVDWLARVEEKHRVALSPAAFVEAYAPLMIDHVRHDVTLFPDAERLLERIEGPAALVTSSMGWYVRAVLERFPLIGEKVEAVVTADDVSKGKPDPTPYAQAAELIGAWRSDCLAFEDSVNGVASAAGAGCRVIGVDRDGLGHLTGAHRVVRSLDECLTGSPASAN
ncbi:MAG: HAD family phosphatase [Fimbriimonadaceae bacterium]|nr:HAD family phosphatase [Fimbriimonadaceae bacterium]QYK54894.1 MAG: HAD family phosphatase [Fimbriimonadaceae bacterium]